MTATAVCCLVGPRCQRGGDSFVARKLVPVDGVTGSPVSVVRWIMVWARDSRLAGPKRMEDG